MTIVAEYTTGNRSIMFWLTLIEFQLAGCAQDLSMAWQYWRNVSTWTLKGQVGGNGQDKACNLSHMKHTHCHLKHTHCTLHIYEVPRTQIANILR